MGSHADRIRALKIQRAIEADREELMELFPGVEFEELPGGEADRAYFLFEKSLANPHYVVTCPLEDRASRIADFGIATDHRLALRRNAGAGDVLVPSSSTRRDKASGAWMCMSDARRVLGLLQERPAQGLQIYDRDAEVVYMVHEAEYDWEYYRYPKE